MLREIYRYPVKSMLGEAVQQATVGERGLAGDRAYAIVESETGIIASVKDPRHWAVLLSVRARTVGEPGAEVVIELPDGSVISSRDAAQHRDAALSQLVGRRVELKPSGEAGRLIRRTDPDLEQLLEGAGELTLRDAKDDELAAAAPEGTVFDHAPVHLISSTSLTRLAELEPDAAIAAARFRPNLVLDLPGGAFVENDLAGAEISIGDELVLVVLQPSARCVVPSLAHGDLERSPAALQAVARHNRPDLPGRGPRPCLGAYANVMRAGRIAKGDPVRVNGAG